MARIARTVTYWRDDDLINVAVDNDKCTNITIESNTGTSRFTITKDELALINHLVEGGDE